MAKLCRLVAHCDLGPLKSLVPCKCHQDSHNASTYYVKTTDSNTYVVGAGSKVKEIFIQCNKCGKINSRNIEKFGIFDYELNF